MYTLLLTLDASTSTSDSAACFRASESQLFVVLRAAVQVLHISTKNKWEQTSEQHQRLQNLIIKPTACCSKKDFYLFFKSGSVFVSHVAPFFYFSLVCSEMWEIREPGVLGGLTQSQQGSVLIKNNNVVACKRGLGTKIRDSRNKLRSQAQIRLQWDFKLQVLDLIGG